MTIHQLYHRNDASTLEAIADAASGGVLTIPITRTFQLNEIGAARRVVAAGIQGKAVLKH